MSLLPSEFVTLRVEASPDVVATRLSEMLSAKRFGLWSPSEPFRGWLRDARFEVRRARGLFRGQSIDPVALGEIFRAGFGSEVRVSMRLHRFDAAFLVGWLGAGIFMVGRLCALAIQSTPTPLVGAATAVVVLVLGGAIFALGALVITSTFRAEARWVRERLVDGLGAVAATSAPDSAAPGNPPSPPPGS